MESDSRNQLRAQPLVTYEITVAGYIEQRLSEVSA